MTTPKLFPSRFVRSIPKADTHNSMLLPNPAKPNRHERRMLAAVARRNARSVV